MKNEEYIARALEGCVIGNGSKQIALLIEELKRMQSKTTSDNKIEIASSRGVVRRVATLQIVSSEASAAVLLNDGARVEFELDYETIKIHLWRGDLEKYVHSFTVARDGDIKAICVKET